MTPIVNLVWYLSAVNHRMLNVECFLDYQWPMGPRSTPPTILVANGSTIKSYPLFMKYTVLGFMVIMPHESLVPWFHGPWNTLWQVFIENSGPMNLWSYEIHEWLNRKLPFHRKFMARNKGMKLSFAVFMGHEMSFMGYSLDIHGIFIKIWFVVVAFNKPWKKIHMLTLTCLKVFTCLWKISRA